MHAKKHCIVTPFGMNGLVWRESIQALGDLGHIVAARGEAEMSGAAVARMLALPPARSNLETRPTLFFSINFRGLDKHGETFAALHGKGLPVAVWCVDNPWNLLAGLRSDFWKQTHLFVTDPSFIPALREHGATNVFHLPLAADATTFASAKPCAAPSSGNETVVFVGRSAFPDKNRFFVGQSVPQEALNCAAALAESGTRPDFSWWVQELACTEELWPGSAARRVALGAEESSLAFRAACLREAAPLGLAVHGDAGWQNILPPTAILRKPVDYYTGLAPIYAAAPFSLNVTSLLLPHGLNQRHFDVWAAGGFCITDNTPGIELFPKELTEPVTFLTPRDIPCIVKRLLNAPEEKKKLAAAWKKHILAEHVYTTRMQKMMQTIFS